MKFLNSLVRNIKFIKVKYEKRKNPYYDENDMLKVRPFSYKLNADNAEGSKEEDDKIILNTVDSIIKHTLKETADKTGYTKETV